MRDKQKKESGRPIAGPGPVRVTDESHDMTRSQLAEGGDMAIDITARKRAEEALRERTQQLQLALQVTRMGVWQSNLQSNSVNTIHGGGPISGLPEGVCPTTGEAFYALVHPDDRPLVAERWRRAIELGEPYQAEFRIVLPDGGVRWVSTQGQCSRDAEGQPSIMIGVDLDITERKRAEEALQRSETELGDFFENAAIGLHCVGPDGTVLRVNQAELGMLGYTREEYVGHHIAEFHADQHVAEDMLRRLREGEVLRDYEARLRCKDGSIKDVQINSSVFWEDGKFTHTRCFTRDITDHRKAEEALREAERKYRDIFENAGEGIFQTTADGRFINANPALARMLGFDSPEELIRERTNIGQQNYVDPTRREEFKRLLNELDAVRGLEYEALRKDGSRFWMSESVRAVRAENGTLLYYEGISEDITERKRAEARSVAFATLARELSGAMTQLHAGRIIAKTARELFGWDACNLDLYDADRDVVHPMLNVDTIDGQQVDLTASISGCKPTPRGRRVINDGPELILREEPIKFDQDSVPFGDKTRPSASIMAVPIRHASTIIGLLTIQSYSLKAYDALALEDFVDLADHCGEALNRIQAEESFYESEERFRQIAVHLEDVVWLTDKNIRKVLYINPAYEKVFRRTSDSVYERLDSFLDNIHPEDRAAVERMLEREWQGDHEPAEYRIVWPDGSDRWILRRTFPIRNTKGEVYLIAGIAQDITERKQAEEELRASEERYRDLVENIQDLICTHDLEGRLLSANRAAEGLLGYDFKNFTGQNFRDILAPEVRDQFDDYLARIRKDGVASGLMLVQTSTGERRIWEYHNTLRTEGVATPIVRGMARDVTDRRRAEAALRESETKFRTLAETAPAAISIFQGDKHTYVNAALELQTGYTRDELLRMPFWEVVHPDFQDLVRERGHARQRGEAVPSRYEVKICTKDNQERWLDVSGSTIEIGGKTAGLGVAIDITERKQAEEARQASERSFRDLFTFAPVGIYQSRPDGTFITVNKTLAEMLAYDSVGELLQVKLDRDVYFSEDERQRLIAEYEDRGYAADLEIQWKRRDGSPIWIQLTAHAIKGANGATEYFEGFVRDITERKQAEESMSNLRRELELTMNSMEEGVHRVDLKGNIVFENPAAARMLGWNVAELLGKPAHATMHHTRQDGTSYPKEDCPIYATFRDGVSRHVTDEVFWRRNGTSFPVEYTTAPMRNDRNEIVATVVTFGDITEREQAEEALRASEERYRELFENAKDAIYIHDLSGRYVSLNRAAEKLSGYSRDEIIGKHFSNFVAPQDLKHVRKNLCKKLDEEGETSYEIDLVTKDRRFVPVEVISRLIYENGQPIGVQGTARDITERRRAQEALQIYSRRLIEAQEAERQNLARELHDEIGQVLTAVRINLQTVQRARRTDASLPQIEESIVIVDEALARIRDLSLELRPSLLDDLGLTAALRWYVDRYGQRTGIAAEVLNGFEGRGRLPRELETECFRIAQEALTNVARHAQATRVSVELKCAADTLVLTITDNGTGFDTESLLKTASAASTLGLRGMKERALAMNGRIEIASSHGTGTKIRASFPLKRRN